MSRTIQDDVLGTLTHDAKGDEFNGVVPFGENKVRISIGFASPSDSVTYTDLAMARAAYLALVAQKANIEAEIVRKLLDLYNNTWRQNGDPINQDQFIGMIEPEHISIELGRVRALLYNDGDLFLGHSLLVRFNDDGLISGIALAG